MAARPRTLPAAIAPVLVGTAAAVEASGELRGRRLHRGADRQHLHPDRDQPRQRLLRREARRRHRRPARAGAGDRRRAWWRRAGCSSRPGSRSPSRSRRASTWPSSPGPVILAGRRRSRSSPASSTRAGRGRTATTGSARLFVFLFFGLVAVNGSYYVQLEQLDWLPLRPLDPGRAARDRDPRRQQRPRHRHRPPRRQAHARGAAGPRAHARPLPGAAVAARTPCWWSAPRRRRPRVGAPRRCSRRRSPREPAPGRWTRTDGPALNGALAGTGALLAAFSLLLLRRPADRR